MPGNIWPTYSSKITGCWKLLSYEVHSSTGSLLSKPHGDNPLGRVQISSKGYLSAHLTNPSSIAHPIPSGKPWQQGEDAEVARIARGTSMYCGYLELFRDESTASDDGSEYLWWQTRVEVSNDPARMGGLEVRRVRYWEEGGKAFMLLQPEKDMNLENGQKGRGVLKWEKFE